MSVRIFGLSGPLSLLLGLAAETKSGCFFEGLDMESSKHEIVKIGVSGTRILGVTRQRIDYIDVAGLKKSLDLVACAKSWVRGHDNAKQEFCLLPGATEQSAAAWNARLCRPAWHSRQPSLGRVHA